MAATYRVGETLADDHAAGFHDDQPHPECGTCQRQPCRLCGGDAGQLIDGAHALCSARAERGLPTPCLGIRCATCNGAGTTGRGGVMLDFDLGPAKIARSIAAQFPPCAACNGRGYTGGEQ
jgi:hypothetical protein